MRSAVIIGCGRMGREHAEAYRECEVPIGSCMDIAPYKAQEFAQEFNTEVLRDDGRSSPKHDFVSICSWDDAHAWQISAALSLECTVIAEKPLCLTFDDLKQIKVLGGNLTCNLPLRYQHIPTETPYHVQADYIWGRADQLDGWRKTCPGYSFILGGGVHVADLICRYGRPMFVTAVGQATGNFPAPTVVSASGQFDDGRTFRMDINCANVGEHTAHVIEWLPRGRREYRIDGADKRQAIRRAVTLGIFHPGFEAHALCFAIERALTNRRVEQVIYP